MLCLGVGVDLRFVLIVNLFACFVVGVVMNRLEFVIVFLWWVLGLLVGLGLFD